VGGGAAADRGAGGAGRWADAAADDRGGARIPKHYLAEGGNANRATAAERGLPAIKRFRRLQEFFRQVLLRIVQHPPHDPQRVGVLGPRVDRAVAVQFEELSPSPVEGLAAAERMAAALTVAQDRAWATPEEARRLWWRVAGDAQEAQPEAA
jgi:hypothetical protein